MRPSFCFITISSTTLSRSTIEHFYTVLCLTTGSLTAMCDRLALRSRDSTRHVCEGPGLSSLCDTLTYHPSPQIRASGPSLVRRAQVGTGVQFRACESSRQGGTATLSAVLLISDRRPASTAGGSGLCLPEPPGGVDGYTHGWGEVVLQFLLYGGYCMASRRGSNTGRCSKRNGLFNSGSPSQSGNKVGTRHPKIHRSGT